MFSCGKPGNEQDEFQEEQKVSVMEVPQPGIGVAAPNPGCSPLKVGPLEKYHFDGFGFKLFLERILDKGPTEEQYLLKFIRNLGLDEKAHTDHHLLRRFVAVNHVNAAWYARGVEKERLLRWFYIVISIALVAGLPIILAYLPKIGNNPLTPEVVIAQLTGAVTGLIALQNVLGSVFGQRQLIGQFWKARTELAEQIYDLETKWRLRPGRALDNGGLNHELEKELEAGIESGRQIVAEETQRFFDAYAWPTVDLGSIWTSASSTAKSLIGGIATPRATADAARRTAETERDVKRRKLDVAKIKRTQFEEERAEVRGKLKTMENNNDTFTGTEERILAELKGQEANLTTKLNALKVEIIELITELAEE